MTRNWNIFNDNSEENYDVANEITYNTEVVTSSLSNYKDTYVLVRGNITIIEHKATQIKFKNCVPFTKCITKIDGTAIDDAEDLDLVIPIYNLIEYSSNYSEATGSLWFYSKMKQLILMQILLIAIISNLSSIKLNYSKTLKLMEKMEF